jgi:hypothetical protein
LRENLLDHRRFQDRRYGLEIAAAVRAVLPAFLEHALEQPTEQRDRPTATWGQLYVVKLPLEPALMAESNVGSGRDTVSTLAGVGWLLTLHS